MITLVEMLDRTAQAHPDAIAVKVDKESISYADLHAQATAVAHCLTESGIQKGDCVGLLLHKSIQAVVSLYGIMKAGAAYVPLDIKSPPQRLQNIVNDCKITIIISSDRAFKLIQPVLEQTTIQTIIGLDRAPIASVQNISWQDCLELPNRNALPKVHLDDMCYILFTSGSTGTPKGIVHTHKSAYSFAHWSAQQFALTNTDIVSNHAPFHFDLSTFDLFASCLVGAQVVLIPTYLTKFPASIKQFIENEKISVWYSVPSALVQLLQRGKLDQTSAQSLRVILFAGEAFPVKYIEALRTAAPRALLANLYGPTETNVCTYYILNKLQYNQPLPIGILCTHFDKIILDEHGEPSSESTGELAVAGPHIMKGYWNRSDLTEASFVSYNNKHYYKTGDLVELLPNDNIAYIGRKDNQVKLRGFRVELGAIEHLLQSIEGVQEGIAYVIGKNEQAVIHVSVCLEDGALDLSPSDILNQLRKALPNYALPSKIDILPSFPRTSNGKIDRKRLSARQ